jgi:hypothetical protein
VTSANPLRDAILAVLRDAEHPLITKEIVALVFDDGAGRPYRYYSRVYSNLRSMASQGLVIWHDWASKVGAHQNTRWEIAADAAAAVPTADLEAMWEASA